MLHGFIIFTLRQYFPPKISYTASQAKSNKVPCVKHPQMESASKPHSYRRKCPDLLLRVQNPHSESLLDKDYNVATTGTPSNRMLSSSLAS